MKKKNLLVRASSKNTLVPNLDALNANPPQRRFIGWLFNETLGDAGGWDKKQEPESIPYKQEYVQAVKEGDLEPADEETAILCGVVFNK